MVIVRLMGGLGNQMFQYAMGKRISLLRKTNLKADVSFLNDKKLNHTNREFELAVFAGDISIATAVEVNKFTVIQKSKIKRGIQCVFPFVFPFHTVVEPWYEYNELILKSPENSLLIGYWQTEKYFLPIQDEIRKDFTFIEPLVGLNKNLAHEISSCNSVSMHIRRGDYVHNPETNLFHGSCSPEYYTKAIELVSKKTNNLHLYIFSDDITWVKANMDFKFPVTYLDNNTGENSYLDMQLMSLCRHNIIANSSFSWWGAWLNNSPDKIIVAPARWFNDSSINMKDIIPEGWYKI